MLGVNATGKVDSNTAAPGLKLELNTTSNYDIEVKTNHELGSGKKIILYLIIYKTKFNIFLNLI